MQKRTIQILSIFLLLSLLTYGVWMTLQYLGIPYHATVLLPQVALEGLRSQNCTDHLVSCGLQALFPSLLHTIVRAAPFLTYALISVILYAAFLVWKVISTGLGTGWTMRIRPVGILLAGIVLLWLLYTSLSDLTVGNMSLRQVVEPTASVYSDVAAPVFQSLQENFNGLKERGCLEPTDLALGDAKVFQYSMACIQGSFFTRVLPPLLFVLVLLFQLLIAGRLVLSRFKLPPLPLIGEAVLSAGLGACVWIALLWTIAVMHILIVPVALGLVVLLPVIGYRHALYWIRKICEPGEERTHHWFHLPTLLTWLLLSYLALNFLTVVRPFPIGWDDLGSYLNRPRLMVSYGAAIFSMPSFQWEYLTSLGFLLFGYKSIFGATASMMVNWTAGLLAIGAIFAFCQLFLGKRHGLLAALLYYSLPLVGHFSFADMKIDNAVFTMGVLGIISAFLALFPVATSTEEDEDQLPPSPLRFLALAGVFIGFGFAMKPTEIMVAMGIVTIIFGSMLLWPAFIGAVFLSLALFIVQGALGVEGTLYRAFGVAVVSAQQMALALIIIGVLCIAIAGFLRPQRLKLVLLSLFVFGAGFALAISPWIIRNNILSGNIIPRLALGVPNTFNPIFDVSGAISGGGERPYRSLPVELRVDPKMCQSTGTTEELDRYWGFSNGWRHYVTLPWRTVMNIDSQGYYVTTTPALLLIPLLFLLPFFWRRKGKWLLWLTCGTGFMLLEWVLLGNGIPWYGIGVFFGLVVGLEALVSRAPDVLNRIVAGVLIIISLFIAFGNRFWQFETQRNLIEYTFGKVSAATLQERTVSHYDDIANEVLSLNKANPARPYLYRMGTFMPYFIPRNLEVIGITDNQLDFFHCLFSEKDAKKTLQRLQALGFHSMVFDTNTATIEKDPQGSLHQKVNEFVGFVNTQGLGMKIVVNDTDAGIAYVVLP